MICMHLSAPMYQNVFRAYINCNSNSDGKETEVTAAKQTWANPSVMLKIEKREHRWETSRVACWCLVAKRGIMCLSSLQKKLSLLRRRKRIGFGNTTQLGSLWHPTHFTWQSANCTWWFCFSSQASLSELAPWKSEGLLFQILWLEGVKPECSIAISIYYRVSSFSTGFIFH